MSDLRVSPDLALPVDAVTETFAFLGKRGSGKSHSASVMAEEMLKAGAQVVVLDCLDVWWGLRSSADGKGPGLPIAIFGGEHGDIPLEPTAGGYMADLLVSEGLSAILVVEGFSKNDQRRFATDFGERLFRRNREPMHLILEEADRWGPQRPMKGEERMLGAYEEIVRRGRSKGIGATLITQRSAVLSKDLLTQTEVLVAMRTPSKHDRRAIEDWFDAHEADEVADVMRTVPSLNTGEAWISSPYWLGILQRVQFRRRETFDSSSTPKVGEKRREVRKLADIDLAAIKEQMSETIERAKADDPRALNARIRALESELRTSRSTKPETVVEEVEVVKEIQVPVFDESLVLRLEAAMEPVAGVLSEVQERLTWETTAHDEVIEFTRKLRDRREDLSRARPAGDRADPVGQHRRGEPAVPDLQGRRSGDKHQRGAQRDDSPPRRHSRGETVPGAASLDRAQRAILTVLATYGPRTNDQLALQTGYRPTASTIGVALSKLRKEGYVEPGQPVRITDEGVTALGDYEPLPTGAALLDFWRSKLGQNSAERKCLDILVDVYPHEIRQPELCEATGYSPTASTIGVAMSKLRKLELAEGWMANPVFMESIGR